MSDLGVGFHSVHAISTVSVGTLLLFTLVQTFDFVLGVGFAVLGVGFGLYFDVSPVLYTHFVLCKALRSIFLMSFSYAPPRVAYSHFVSQRYFMASATGIPDTPWVRSSYVAIDFPTNPACPDRVFRAFTIPEFRRSF